jgi:hypothetical protein
VIEEIPREIARQPGLRRVPARIVLPAHQSTSAILFLAPASDGTWLLRTAGYFVHWIGATAVTALVTFFDPHVLPLPILIGGAWFYQAFKRRNRVAHFQGSCPRCANELTIPPNSWVGFPYRMDCLNCHFVPEVELVGPTG